jgi:CheY-like chemotaxis protein
MHDRMSNNDITSPSGMTASNVTRIITTPMTKKPASILIVDDTPSSQNLLTTMLENLPVTLIQAMDGVEALAQLEQKNIDLIITDIQMPILDGVALINEIKNRAEYEAIPILVITAYSDKVSIEKAFKAGADDYLTKPLEQIEVLARIDNLLRRQRAEKRWDETVKLLASQNKQLQDSNHELKTIIQDLKDSLNLNKEKTHNLLQALSENTAKRSDMAQMNSNLTRQIVDLNSKNRELMILLSDAESRLKLHSEINEELMNDAIRPA